MSSYAFEGKSWESIGAASCGSEGERGRSKSKGVMGWLRRRSSRISRHGSRSASSCQVGSLDVEERQCELVHSAGKEGGLRCKATRTHLSNRSLAEMFNYAGGSKTVHGHHDFRKSLSSASRAPSAVSDTECIKRAQSATSIRNGPASEVEQNCYREPLGILSHASPRAENSSSRGSSLAEISRLSSAVSRSVFGRKAGERTSSESRVFSAEVHSQKEAKLVNATRPSVVPASQESPAVEECADPETPEFSPSSWLLKFQLQGCADSEVVSFYHTSVCRITDYLDELESKATCLLSEVDAKGEEDVAIKHQKCAFPSGSQCTDNTPVQIRREMDRDDKLFYNLTATSNKRLALHALLWQIKRIRKVLGDFETDARVEDAFVHDLEGEQAQLEAWQHRRSTLRRTENYLKHLYDAVCESRSDSLRKYHRECKRLNQSIQLLRDKIMNAIDDTFSCFEKLPHLERVHVTSSKSLSQGKSTLRTQIPGVISELKLYAFDEPVSRVHTFTPDVTSKRYGAPDCEGTCSPLSIADALPRSVCVRSVPPGLALACSKAEIERYEDRLWNLGSSEGSSVQGKWGSFRIFEQWLSDAMKWQFRDAFMYTELRERSCAVDGMVRSKKLDVQEALKLRLKQLWLGRSVEMRASHSTEAQQRLLQRLMTYMPNDTPAAPLPGTGLTENHYVENREEVERALMYAEGILSMVGRVVATPAYQNYIQVIDTLYPRQADYPPGDFSAVLYLKKYGERIRQTLRRLDDLEGDDTGSLIVEKECCQLEAAIALLAQELVSIESKRSLRESQLFGKRDHLKRDLETLSAAFDLENSKLKSIEIQWEKLDALEELVRGCIPAADEINAIRLKVENCHKQLETERALLNEEREKLEAIQSKCSPSHQPTLAKRESISDDELARSRSQCDAATKCHDRRMSASHFSKETVSESRFGKREASDVSDRSNSSILRHKGIMTRLFRSSKGKHRVKNDEWNAIHTYTSDIVTDGGQHTERQGRSEVDVNSDRFSTSEPHPLGNKLLCAVEPPRNASSATSRGPACLGIKSKLPLGETDTATAEACKSPESKHVDPVNASSVISKTNDTVHYRTGEMPAQEPALQKLPSPDNQQNRSPCELKPETPRCSGLMSSKSTGWAAQASILESIPNIFEDVDVYESQTLPMSDKPCVPQRVVTNENPELESESSCGDSKTERNVLKDSHHPEAPAPLDLRRHSCSLEATSECFSKEYEEKYPRDSIHGSSEMLDNCTSNSDLHGAEEVVDGGECDEEILPLIPFPSETTEQINTLSRKSFGSLESRGLRGQSNAELAAYNERQVLADRKHGTSIARCSERLGIRTHQVSPGPLFSRRIMQHGSPALHYIEEDDRIELFLTNGKADLTSAVFSSPIFSLLDSDDKQHCIHLMQSSIVQIPKDCTLLQRGEKVDTLYFLVAGRLGQSLSIYGSGEHKSSGPVDYTGRRRSSVGTDTNPQDYPIVLLSGAFVTPRAFVREGQSAHSVVALQASTLQKLSFHSFQQVISGCIFRKAPQVLSFFSSCPILDSLTRREKAQVVALMKWRIYLPDEVIYHQGEVCRELLLIIKGHARALRVVERSGSPEVVEEYSAGDAINSLALLHDVPASISVVATSPEGCVVASLDRAAIQDNIGDANQILSRRYERAEDKGKEKALKHVSERYSHVPPINDGRNITFYGCRGAVVDMAKHANMRFRLRDSSLACGEGALDEASENLLNKLTQCSPSESELDTFDDFIGALTGSHIIVTISA